MEESATAGQKHKELHDNMAEGVVHSADSHGLL